MMEPCAPATVGRANANVKRYAAMAGVRRISEVAEFEDFTVRGNLIKNWLSREVSLKNELGRLEERTQAVRAELMKVQTNLQVVEELKSSEMACESKPGSILMRGTALKVDEGLTVGRAILQALRQSQCEMKPREIRQWLIRADYKRPINAKYFYTALRRMVDNRSIIQTKAGGYAAAQNGQPYHVESAPER